MEKYKTFFKMSLVFITLVLLLVSSTASAATENDTGNATIEDNYVSSTALATTEQIASPKITETRITTSGHAEYPKIYGDKIVWEDGRNIDWKNYSGKYDIYMYDLSNKKETQITSIPDYQASPTIYGNRIVYSTKLNGDYRYDICMYDLSTKKETPITIDDENKGFSGDIDPAIYGDKIVWATLDDGGEYAFSQIYMYDLSTKKETQITTSNEAFQPEIYGNRIVWCDLRNEKSDIYMYDLSTKKETRITTSGSAWNPAIYGDRIVWEDDRNGRNTDIYMYDLSTKKQTQITSSPDAQTYPAIYGDRIVWEDDGGEDDGGTNHGIYMYDISTNQKMKISANGSAYYPAIYGNNIVWKYSDWNIYMGTVSNPEPKPPVAALSASPTSGKAPLKVQFTDKSTGTPTKWKWSFGDGTYSTTKNPAHTYSKAGKYTVSLTVKNAAGSNTLKKSGYINVAAPLKAPVAAFSASPRSGKAPLKVQFTDKSSNSPTSWKWSFGDGMYSTTKNPAHTYSKAGKYTVSLTVKNAKGSNTKTVSGYVVVAKK